MGIDSGNRLKQIRERKGIAIQALAKASGVSERIVRRVEEIDGTPRLELKVRLVAGLNTLLDTERFETEEVFAGWHAHRRLAKQ